MRNIHFALLIGTSSHYSTITRVGGPPPRYLSFTTTIDVGLWASGVDVNVLVRGCVNHDAQLMCDEVARATRSLTHIGVRGSAYRHLQITRIRLKPSPAREV